MKVLPCNMVDILCTFCDCNVYKLLSLFFYYRRICYNEYTIFLVQQLDDIIITSKCFNFKKNSNENLQLFGTDFYRREFNLVSAALLLFYSYSNYSWLWENSGRFLLAITLQQCFYKKCCEKKTLLGFLWK